MQTTSTSYFLQNYLLEVAIELGYDTITGCNSNLSSFSSPVQPLFEKKTPISVFCSSPSNWNLHLQIPLREAEIEELSLLLSLLKATQFRLDSSDSRIWTLLSSGPFSVPS